MDGGPSFASRRPAATGLPAFSLPPPDIPSTKYPASASLPAASSFGSFSSSSNKPVLSPLSPSASSQPVPFAPPKPPLPTASSVLIPPSGVANDGLSPLSSGVNTGSSMGSQPGTTAGSAGGNYSYMSGSWPTPQPPSGATSYYSGGGNHNPVASPLLNQPYPNARSLYQQVSPSVPQFPQSSGRHISSPAIPDGLPPPAPYHQSSPVFLTPISGIGGVGGGVNNGPHQISHTQGHTPSQTTPTSSGPPEGSYRAHQQQHHQQQQHQQQQQQQQQQHQQESNQQQHGMQYPYRTTPQQGHFATYPTNNSQQPQPSPTSRTPPSADVVSASHAVSRAMSISGPGQMSGMAPPMGFASGRQGMFGYQMSGPGGPIMTNMHQPGTPMVAVGNVGSMMSGGYNPGPSAHSHNLHVYGHSNPHQAHQDRPFKCDECIQSFNRNHDLKRHKKIHLAVKPFPCTYCEKAFSRKDALKRHRLVKGCGERAKADDSNDSPPDRSDIMSDTTEGSPRTAKKEPL
ncbi:hypothetical protein CONLIGDRAFT_297472 [Coniochaeta ligniaria NRRL 30616]|uniref:pH-response transcription factor pacC/RIM101 n=1 Tax=Coniochaeta ligniaria NRRL 30616 TaxID=1408157 RepID=A0A1J7IV17_9PEZI|nr:hypothetical protein CONLIGDRAFT_297472 [Coniochaeta ligniaria NRRL 30616]